MGKLLRRLRIVAFTVMVVFAFAIGIVTWLWQDRDDISALEWPLAETTAEPGESVTITWLGVTTLLIDDNETQLLIDGFFSRFGVLDYLFREISTDIANVNYVMAEFHIDRLAAIIPAHSHYDHAMDVGIVANRSSAGIRHQRRADAHSRHRRWLHNLRNQHVGPRISFRPEVFGRPDPKSDASLQGRRLQRPDGDRVDSAA